jgi:hypothetical protein
MKRLLSAALCLLLVACNGITQEAKNAAEAAKRSQYETRESWKRVLTYSPPPEAPLAQRRFCYKKLTDVVCYDTEQNTTSPLVAMQEGMPGRLVAGKQSYEDAQFSNNPPAYAGSAAATDRVISTPLPSPSGSMSGEVVTFGVPDASVQQQNIPVKTVGDGGRCIGGNPFPCKESNYVPNANVGK